MNEKTRSEAVDTCGCRLERTENGLHMVDCPLHGAARELLEACKAALVYVQSDPAVYPLIVQLRAAIAKATEGQP